MRTFCIPTEMSCGGFEILIEYILKQGFNNILILTSKSINQIDEVSIFLKQLSLIVDLQIFGKVKPNAPTEDLDFVIKNYIKPSVILAIGGGSVIDSAKALSLCWFDTSINVSNYINKSFDFPDTQIPLIVVPTTAGSGSELSHSAIVYDSLNSIKGGIRSHKMAPRFILINENLYKYANIKFRTEVGFDCLSHAIETYVSKQSNEIVKYQSVNAIVNTLKHLPDSLFDSKQSILTMALTSSFMGVNLANSTTCLPHRIQYALAPYTNASHAVGIIALYKGWLEVIKNTDEFISLNNNLMKQDIDLIYEINLLKIKLNIDYTLDYIGIKHENFNDIVNAVTGNLTVDPCYISKDTIFEILNKS